jgi:hypothetical protein
MRSKPSAEIGKAFADPTNLHYVWRVQEHLGDGTHVVLIRAGEPSRRKTVSFWALKNRRLFVPVEQELA